MSLKLGETGKHFGRSEVFSFAATIRDETLSRRELLTWLDPVE
jgi:hypothetical protein